MATGTAQAGNDKAMAVAMILARAVTNGMPDTNVPFLSGISANLNIDQFQTVVNSYIAAAAKKSGGPIRLDVEKYTSKKGANKGQEVTVAVIKTGFPPFTLTRERVDFIVNSVKSGEFETFVAENAALIK